MAKEKSIVEEAIIQMKNLEETVAENAKGILASTMKEEIKELVKESLNEQNDEEEIDTEMDIEEPEMEEPEMEDDIEMDMEMDTDNIGDLDSIDLTGKSDEEVLKVFELMGPEDQIMVKKDTEGNIHLSDDKTGKEYMIVGEGDEDLYGDLELEDEEDMMSGGMMEDDTMDFEDDTTDFGDKESIEDIMNTVFGEETDESIYETEMDEEEEENESEEMVYEVEMEEEEMEEEDEESEGVVYEIVMDDEEDESYEEEDESYLGEAKKAFKAKGQGMGNPSKFKYKKNPNQGEGFKVVKKNANKTMGTGSAKKGFTYDKSGENLDGEFKIKPKGAKKAETKEAARTYGNGSKEGRGLRKGITPNRNLKFESVDSSELQLLREKNEEYRKALNVFRNKLNEVAVFNSNLAYATRLFTEHSTSKQEKINILRRFDGVETIKESKNLYKTIKEELSGSSAQPMNESFSSKIEKAPSTGSAINLIESKTYENPQFLRMKDLMSKLK
jgi:hypothetical protein